MKQESETLVPEYPSEMRDRGPDPVGVEEGQYKDTKEIKEMVLFVILK